MPAITSRASNSAVVNDSIPLPKVFPQLPEKVKTRFPDMVDWEQRTNKWWGSAFTALTEFNRQGTTIINQNYADAKNLRVSVNGLTAEIIEINEVIISGDTATARRLVSVSAMAGVSGSITVAAVAPGSPGLNDYWIDTSDPLIPITYQWDGGAWVEVTTQISSAGVANEVTARIAAVTSEQTARITQDGILASNITTVAANLATETTNRIAAVTSEQTARITADGILASDITTVAAAVVTEEGVRAAAVTAEATARATADGFLEGKYTLTVIAGDVVTGMNITSSSGAGTDISSVIFRATDFKIYNSVSGVEMFSVSGTAVKLGATLTVDTANSKVYIGTGTYGNTNTSFYVDSTGQFSLKDKLTWDGTTLTVGGSISSTGLNVGTVGNVRGGQTAYNTGTGFWLGYEAAAYKFSIGNGSTAGLTWNGTVLTVAGTVNATAGYFGTGSTVVQVDADGLVVGTGGSIRGGQTAYDTGGGFWMGYDGSNYVFSIGDGGSNFLKFDGAIVQASQLVVVDYLTVTNLIGTATITSQISAGVATFSISDGGGGAVFGSTQIQLQATQVVTIRQAAVADATGAGDVVAQLNALLARIRTHGLIAP